MNRPEVHDVLRRWRAVADGHDPRAILVGETYVLNLDTLMPYYGNGEDELNLAFNFLFVHADLDADELRRDRRGRRGEAAAGRLARLHGLQPRRGPLHHALGRRRPAPVAARAADAAHAARHAVPLLRRRARAARGGDGLADGARPGRQAHRRPVAQPRPLPHADAVERASPAAASPPDGATPWLPFGDLAAHNVADQAADRGSQLWLTRDLIALRREEEALRTGAYAALETPAGAWAWRRGDAFVIGAQPLRTRRPRWPASTGTRRDRHGPGARRRGRRRGARARAVGGGARPHGVSALEPLLSEEGWAYASLPPQEPGDPGRFHALFGRDSLITALQVLPAAPEVARATLRALAARQGRVDDPEVDEEPGKILHEYRPVAEPRFAEAGLARPRRRAPLLRQRGRDELVPRRARRAGRRGARGGARAAPGARRALARGRARRGRRASCGTARARRAPAGSRSRAGATRSRPWSATRTARGSSARTARRPAPPLADADSQAVAVAALDALAAARPGRRLARARGRAARPALGLGRGDDGRGGRRPAGPRRRLPARLAAVGGRARAGRGGGRGRAARRARRAHAIRPADALLRAPGVPPAAPTTAAASGRSTAGSAGAACARPGARRRRPSASAPACSRRSTRSASRRSSTPSTPTGALEPVPVANRVQAWTVGARWALEHGWDGGRDGRARAPPLRPGRRVPEISSTTSTSPSIRASTSATCSPAPVRSNSRSTLASAIRRPRTSTRESQRGSEGGGRAAAAPARPARARARPRRGTGSRPPPTPAAGRRRDRARASRTPSGRSPRRARAAGRPRRSPPPRAAPRRRGEVLVEAVLAQPEGDHRRVVRPDRAEVVADGVVARLALGQRPDPPAGEHRVRHQRVADRAARSGGTASPQSRWPWLEASARLGRASPPQPIE